MIPGPSLVKVMIRSRLPAPPTEDSLRPRKVEAGRRDGDGVGVGGCRGWGGCRGRCGCRGRGGFRGRRLGCRVGVGVGEELGDGETAAARDGEGETWGPPKPPRDAMSRNVAPRTMTRRVPMAPMARRRVWSVTHKSYPTSTASRFGPRDRHRPRRRAITGRLIDRPASLCPEPPADEPAEGGGNRAMSGGPSRESCGVTRGPSLALRSLMTLPAPHPALDRGLRGEHRPRRPSGRRRHLGAGVTPGRPAALSHRAARPLQLAVAERN